MVRLGPLGPLKALGAFSMALATLEASRPALATLEALATLKASRPWRPTLKAPQKKRAIYDGRRPAPGP